MIKTAIINLGDGSLESGFPLVIASILEGDRFWEDNGSLPSATELAELHKKWNEEYDLSLDLQATLSTEEDEEEEDDFEEEDDDDFEDKPGVTRYSEVSFKEIREKITACINTWLNSEEFIRLEQGLRMKLNRDDGVRVIIKTDNNSLWKLPWERWDFFDDFHAAISYSKLTADSTAKIPKKKKVRILAIRGNDKGVNLEQSLNPLESLQDVEIVKLEKPSRQEFDAQLWDNTGWHILFYTGHSRSFDREGKIYINDNLPKNYLTIEELKDALKEAINRGLKIAFFNSCDGVGLATALADLKISQVVVMKREVPNQVAQNFFKYFMEAFAGEKLRFDLAVDKARKKLQGEEDEFPGVSWLPLIYQNSAEKPPTWQDFLEDIPLWKTAKCTDKLTQSYHTKTGISLLDDLAINLVKWRGENLSQYGTKVAFTPDGTHFVSCGYEVVELWNFERKQRVLCLMQPAPESFSDRFNYWEGYFTAVATDGQIIAGYKDCTIMLWDSLGTLLHTFSVPWFSLAIYIHGFESVVFSRDGQILAITNDKSIELWNITTNKLLNPLNGHSNKVNHLAFSPDGRTLASCSDDKTIKLWDMETGRVRNTLSGHSREVIAVAFSPDGKTLASASHDRTVKLWCMDTFLEKNTLSGHSNGVLTLAFCPLGTTLATGGDDKSIILWDWVKGTLKCRLLEHERAVVSLAFSPDGRSLLSGSRDQTIRVWETG